MGHPVQSKIKLYTSVRYQVLYSYTLASDTKYNIVIHQRLIPSIIQLYTRDTKYIICILPHPPRVYNKASLLVHGVYNQSTLCYRIVSFSAIKIRLGVLSAFFNSFFSIKSFNIPGARRALLLIATSRHTSYTQNSL